MSTSRRSGTGPSTRCSPPRSRMPATAGPCSRSRGPSARRTASSAAPVPDPACHQIGKHPRNAHGLKDATRERDAILAWWRRWPRANLAIPHRRRRVRCPRRRSRQGRRRELAQLEQMHGPLPATAETLTRSGGRYLLFRPSGLRNSTSLIRPGLDIRGDGGYIVVAPSVHQSWRRYVPEGCTRSTRCRSRRCRPGSARWRSQPRQRPLRAGRRAHHSRRPAQWTAPSRGDDAPTRPLAPVILAALLEVNPAGAPRRYPRPRCAPSRRVSDAIRPLPRRLEAPVDRNDFHAYLPDAYGISTSRRAICGPPAA